MGNASSPFSEVWFRFSSLHSSVGPTHWERLLGSPTSLPSENDLLSKKTRRTATPLLKKKRKKEKEVGLVCDLIFFAGPLPSPAGRAVLTSRKIDSSCQVQLPVWKLNMGRSATGGRIRDDISRTSCHLSWFSQSNTPDACCGGGYCWLGRQAVWVDFNEKWS